MEDSYDFGKPLNTTCNKLLYVQHTGTKISSLMTICNVLCFGEQWKGCVHDLFPSWTVVWESIWEKADKCCSILKFYCGNSQAPRVINLEMAQMLKQKGFNDVLTGQKLCRQCATEYEKLTKPPENENMTEIIETEFTRRISTRWWFFAVWITQKETHLTLESIGVSPVNINEVSQQSCFNCKM